MSEENEVRIEEQLRVKIGEAKNIPPRNGSVNGYRDVYCSLCLDKELIFRTSVVEKTLNPFFGEEFQFEIPRRFRFLTFYVHDRERSANRDKALGKVAIKRDQLKQYNGKDHWFAITPVDADSEVEGKIFVELKIEQCSKSNGFASPRLIVNVIECSDLGIVNGSCDPYVVATLYHGITRLETKRTKVKKKTTCPRFDETFYFDLSIKGQNHDRNSFKLQNTTLSCFEIRIMVMHDVSGVFGNVFLGEIKIPLSDVPLEAGIKAWYLLRPREVCLKSENKKCDKGSLRLKIEYTSDYVLSSRHYDPLRNLLLKSPEIRPITSSTACILGEIVSNKVQVAQPLVKLFIHYEKIIAFIRVLAEREISKVTDPNTIFRGNTLISKCLDELMKLIGMRYLHETLRDTIDKILTEKKPCEIDPSRLKDGDNLSENLQNLTNYVDNAFKAITNSALMCPQLMCEAFGVLKELALQYFPDCREVCYSVISGFIFLRFFAPAILNPKLFEMTDQQIDPQTSRSLTLVSKTVQSIVNIVSSRCLNSQVFKEDYMAFLYKSFFTDQHIESTRVFLELISSSAIVSVPRMNAIPVILKESLMMKRSHGKKRIHLKFRTFKKRYFCLTTQTFFYAKAKNKTPLCQISISDILAVERLQEESFKMKNMFQVVQKDRALYIQANNCVEEKEWIDILTKVCQTNQNRLTEYHPSAYIGKTNSYIPLLSCKATNESAPGCCPVSVVSVPADIGVHIDPDREVARIHNILLNHIKTIDDLITLCISKEQQSSETVPIEESNFIIEDYASFNDTLKELKKCVMRLEQAHKQYMRRVCIRTIYGSEQAPIGDDNYLMMLAKHCTS
ncbi:ras GTPase-activating protein 3-like protein [Dinothrombium tinctorium]|uniref:Ras GTPase-activating protein 3-like protein n=1 Tax=Dinothrombium tinctorium TaxID=1965070 RepID=A0A443RM66_9ACAR|nr:ras GTPase-activating protein 3-like protein [Dinothrombium tinctorium]